MEPVTEHLGTGHMIEIDLTSPLPVILTVTETQKCTVCDVRGYQIYQVKIKGCLVSWNVRLNSDKLLILSMSREVGHTYTKACVISLEVS